MASQTATPDTTRQKISNLAVSIAPYVPALDKLVLAHVIGLWSGYGQKAPISVLLLERYVSDFGEWADFDLGPIPIDWQHWIVAEATRAKVRLGQEHTVSGYAHKGRPTPPYDLTYALGTFRITVSAAPNRRRLYEIRDRYEFGFDLTKKDPSTNQHGFKLPDMSEEKRKELESWLPTRRYQHPCGFQEGFEVRRRSDKGWELIIPWQVLQDNGRPFNVVGRFIR